MSLPLAVAHTQPIQTKRINIYFRYQASFLSLVIILSLAFLSPSLTHLTFTKKKMRSPKHNELKWIFAFVAGDIKGTFDDDIYWYVEECKV